MTHWYCRDEIAHHTWEFDPSDISLMLSPKTLQNDIQPEKVECFEDAQKYCDFSVNKPFFEPVLERAVNSLPPLNWPKEKTPDSEDDEDEDDEDEEEEEDEDDEEKAKKRILEKDYYSLLITFLNDCIEGCGSALNEARSSGKYENVPELSASQLYSDLQYVKSDTYMFDGVGGARQSKPGGHNLKQGDKICWGVKGTNIFQMEIPVEVKSSWPRLLPLAASCARCSFRASPTRSWSLVLGFNYSNNILRFLIFHRGGCTASTDMNLDSELGRKDACRLILTMLLWTEDYHAGLCCFSTDEEFAIPDPERKSTTLNARVQKNLYHTVAIRTRGTLVNIISIPGSNRSTKFTSPTTSPGLWPATQTVAKLMSKARNTNHPAISQHRTGSKRKSDGKHEPDSITSKSRKKSRKGPSLSQTNDSEPMETISPGSSQITSRSIAQGIKVHYLRPESSSQSPVFEYPCDRVLLKFCWPDNVHRCVEGQFLSSASGAFGTPSHVVSYNMLEPSGIFVSNRIFLPGKQKSKYEAVWWNVWQGKQGKQVTQYTVKRPNYCDATCHLFGTLGSSLLGAPSSWSLLESITHALTGWLAYYQNGFMHRDVSIGNVLHLEIGLEMDPVEIKDPFQPGPGRDESSQEVTNAIAETRKDIKEINGLVKELGISSECKGILIDGDMAADWRTYFDKDHHSAHSVSGPDEFMSANLLDAMGEYLHSPVDDIHSFFWVTVWAVLFNSHNKHGDLRSPTEILCWDDWMKNPKTKEGIIRRLSNINHRTETLSPITTQMVKFLRKWFDQANGLQIAWVETRDKDHPHDSEKEWLTTHFHYYAYHGICESLRLILEYRKELIGHDPFPQD